MQAHLLFISALVTLASAQLKGCEVFTQASCPFVEDNMVDYVETDSTTVCQDSCAANADCNYFTHFLDNGYCYFLISCETTATCANCISGPTEPPFASCQWPPVPTTTSDSTSSIVTTTTTKKTTTSTTPSTTSSTTSTTSTTTATTTTTTATSTTSAAAGCGDILFDRQCDLDEMNILDTQHHLSVGQCQDECEKLSECKWFTWYIDDVTPLTLCLLLQHCDETEPCPGCVSGPSGGVDVDTCSDAAHGGDQETTTPTTPIPTTTTTTQTTTPPTTTPVPTTTTTEFHPSTPPAPSTTPSTCDAFSTAACDITEYNTVGVQHDLTVGGCQDMCAGNPECHAFTWYPSLGSVGICFMLKDCNDLELCPYCVSGPEDGTDVDDCFDFTTPQPPSTTVQSTSSNPVTSTSAVDECGVFTTASCDITDTNNLDLVHDVFVGTCQDMCAGNPDCNWFTWYNVSGLRGTCWFLDHCASQEPCGECVSGPAEGPDVDQCLY